MTLWMCFEAAIGLPVNSAAGLVVNRSHRTAYADRCFCSCCCVAATRSAERDAFRTCYQAQTRPTGVFVGDSSWTPHEVDDGRLLSFHKGRLGWCAEGTGTTQRFPLRRHRGYGHNERWHSVKPLDLLMDWLGRAALRCRALDIASDIAAVRAHCLLTAFAQATDSNPKVPLWGDHGANHRTAVRFRTHC
jgi:hypothetical protein